MCPKPAYTPGTLWRGSGLKKCSSQRLVFVWLKVTTSMWVRSALQLTQISVSEPGRSHTVPSLHSFPRLSLQGFRLASPTTGQLNSPHSAVEVKDRWLQPSHCLSLFSFTLNAHWLSHMQNLSCMHSPLQNKLFGIKVQSHSNNHVNYLFCWGKSWVNNRFSDTEELLVSTANIIFSSGLVFHKTTWSKGVCPCNQVTQGKVST